MGDLPKSDRDWTAWIATHTEQDCRVPPDYGLSKIAHFLGQETALHLGLDAAKQEAAGNIQEAIRLYSAAYRKWPALDSSVHGGGGVPREVRREAIQAGFLNDKRNANVLLDVVGIPEAQSSRVIMCRKLLSDSDIADVFQIQRQLGTLQQNNPENARHAHKSACMLNNPPNYTAQTKAPHVVGKILEFAQRAWIQGDWSGPKGPLEHVRDGSLSIRVVELWEYSVGGGLTDPYHYDTDSVITIVTLLSDANDFRGGDFRTWESGNVHARYDMDKGDSVAFVSHKYHNVTQVESGCRRSLVMELWQGGVGHEGR